MLDKSLIKPGSYSKVVIAPVDPLTNKVSIPLSSPDDVIADSALSVILIISPSPLVLILNTLLDVRKSAGYQSVNMINIAVANDPVSSNLINSDCIDLSSEIY